MSGMRAFAGRVTGWDRLTWDQKCVVRYRAQSGIASLLSLLPIPLWLLLRWAGSDKEVPGGHLYGRTYDAIFRHLKYQRIKLLEIGIGGYYFDLGGRSLLAWQSFFPFGSIVACDIEPKPMLAGRRRRIYRSDQSSAGDLAILVEREGPFNIIIDDGSHLSAHQIFTFLELFPTLHQDGLYIIEDVQTSYWPGKIGTTEWDGAMIDTPEFAKTCVGYFCDFLKYINHAEFVPAQHYDPMKIELAKQIKSIRFEHNLIIITKGNNQTTSLHAADLAAWSKADG
jgi:demethylmacrocin O-methyltransferase